MHRLMDVCPAFPPRAFGSEKFLFVPNISGKGKDGFPNKYVTYTRTYTQLADREPE